MNRALLSFSVVTASLLLGSVPFSVSAEDSAPPPPIITADPPPLAPEEIKPPSPPTTASAPLAVPAPVQTTPAQTVAAPAVPVTPPAPPVPAVVAEPAPAPVVTSEPPTPVVQATPTPPVSAPSGETNSLDTSTQSPTRAEEAPSVPSEPAQPSEVATAPEAKTTAKYGPRDDTKFQLLRPSLSVHLEYSLNALGGSDVSAGQRVASKGISMAAEYDPPFIQKIGVLGIGPVISLYPLIPASPSITNNYFSIWSAGVQLHYQARFFREQILVPEVGYDFERLSYHLQNAQGGFTVSGPMLGLYLLLNPFEPSTAFDFYTDSGALRTYLTAEIRTLKGSDANINVSGTSSFFGLRVEF